METVEMTGDERPIIRKVVERDAALYKRRRWPEGVLADPELVAEVTTGEMQHESLALQVAADDDGPLVLEGEPSVLADSLTGLIVEMADRLDPLHDGLDVTERQALRIATLAGEVRRLDAAATGVNR